MVEVQEHRELLTGSLALHLIAADPYLEIQHERTHRSIRYDSPTVDTHTEHAFRNVCTENAPGSPYRANVCCSLMVVVAMHRGSTPPMPAQPNCQFARSVPSTLFATYFGNKYLMEQTNPSTFIPSVPKSGKRVSVLCACIREGLAHACHRSWQHAR